MKRIIVKFQKVAIAAMSCMALLVTVANTNQICYFCLSQPKPPAGMDRFRKHL